MSIIGECPHCNETVWRLLPDADLPKFSKEKCPECDKPVWVYYSRIDPTVYTSEQFDERFIVNEDEKSIKPRTIEP